jgi:hypothetical protein
MLSTIDLFSHRYKTGIVNPVHAMKAYRGIEVELHKFLLTSALDRGKWSTSLPGCFTPE